MKHKYTPLILVVAGILAIFIGRTLLAAYYSMPRTSDLFDSLAIVGSLLVISVFFRWLVWTDWITAMVLGVIVGVGMQFTTIFSPYPFFGFIHGALSQGIIRGLFTFIATLGGLVVMRQGGPIQLHSSNGNWRNTGWGILLGLGIGIPLAIINVFALKFSQGQSIHWQKPIAAIIDAFQPGIVEEVIYRFALWGLLWLVLRKKLPSQAALLAGLLVTLVHNYIHFDDLFTQSPLMAIGMGTIMAILWGLPELVLARKRGLESAIAFHWIQDAARFLAGF